jgi:hypothetical protein
MTLAERKDPVPGKDKEEPGHDPSPEETGGRSFDCGVPKVLPMPSFSRTNSEDFAVRATIGIVYCKRLPKSSNCQS